MAETLAKNRKAFFWKGERLAEKKMTKRTE